MTHPTIEPIKAFSDNYIWLLHDGRSAYVVDPGDAEPVLQALQERHLQLEGVLITHHHPDHVGGVVALKTETACTVWGPHNPSVPQIDQRLGEGDSVDVLGVKWQILEVPGHTLDHIAYVSAGAVFCGDTLFAGGCGRVFEGTFPMMRQSLAKLRRLPPETRVYCAHEYTLSNLAFATSVAPDDAAIQRRLADCQQLRAADRPTVPSSIQEECASNPFLRWDDPAIYQALTLHDKAATDDHDAVFAALRQWKDNF